MDVHEILAARRKRAEGDREERVWALYRDHPDLADLQEEKIRLGKDMVQAVLAGDKERAGEDREKMEEVGRAFDQALQALRLPADYLEVHYACPDCQDTGFVDGVSCHCRNLLVLNKLYEKSSIGDLLRRQNFDHFDLDLFRKDRQEGEDLSPYENMKAILKDIREDYIPYFGDKSPSLYFFGRVGTGKTYLVNAIAKALLDRGKTVFYQTSYDLLEFMVDYSFTRQEDRGSLKEKRDYIFDADLLVIDDLGTENINSMTKSALFEVINGRMIRQKPTIISSNLQPYELGKRYDDRIFSRIGNEYILYEVYGSDLRGNPGRKA